jgi:hypothetical protein
MPIPTLNPFQALLRKSTFYAGKRETPIIAAKTINMPKSAAEMMIAMKSGKPSSGISILPFEL